MQWTNTLKCEIPKYLKILFENKKICIYEYTFGSNQSPSIGIVTDKYKSAYSSCGKISKEITKFDFDAYTKKYYDECMPKNT